MANPPLVLINNDSQNGSLAIVFQFHKEKKTTQLLSDELNYSRFFLQGFGCQ
jgi:hypothetical protein